MQKPKDVLTTGQVARICKVAPRTVSKWFDSGRLSGYRIPGSKDRRIPVSELVGFLKAHGMPINGLAAGPTRVLVLDDDPTTVDTVRGALRNENEIEVDTARSAFEAGLAVERFQPTVMLVDVSLADVCPNQMCHDLRAMSGVHSLKLIAMRGGMTEGQGQSLLQTGFDAYLSKPFEMGQLQKVILMTLDASR